MSNIKKLYYSIDLEKQSIINAKLNPLTTTQRTALSYGTGDSGVVCWDLDQKALYFWDGNSWIGISKFNFIDLLDAPNSYTGDAGKFLRVTSTEDGIEFHILTKSDIGLSNVDNTSDLNKPISTATHTALTAKADKTITVGVAGNGLTGGGDLSTSRNFALDFGYLDLHYAALNTGVLSFNSRVGAVVPTNGDYDTSQVTENPGYLYFTNQRARSAVSSGTGISYNAANGIIINSAPDQVVSLGNGAGIVVSGLYPTFTISSTITQYTDALARLAISLTASGSSGAATYNNLTGVLNIPIYSLAGLGGEPAITVGLNSQYWRGDKSWQTLDTLAVVENTNLYYTDARARNVISAGTGMSYNNLTGIISTTITQYTDALARAAITLTVLGSSGSATYSNTTGVINIPTYTLAGLGGIGLTGLSAVAPLSYNNTTGAFSISQANTSTDGYLSSIDWNTFNNKQVAYANLTTIGALANANGFLRQNGAGVFSYDTSVYLTANQNITLSGEASGSGTTSIVVTLSNSAVIGKVLTGLNLASGGTIVATDSILQAFGKIQNQIAGMAGGVVYEGLWNASTNTPTITSSVGVKGYYYVVSVAGSTNINGITDWKIGDWIIFNGSTWDKVDNTDAVSSVNGFTGAVSLTTANISEVTNLYYTDVRARAAISTTVTGLTYNNTTGVLSITTGYVIPTTIEETNWNSAYTNMISSLTVLGNSGAATKIAGVLNIPTYTFDGLSPMTTAGDLIYGGALGAGTRLGIGGANTVLHGGVAAPTWAAVVEADITLSNNVTNNASTTRHGFLPLLPNNAALYLNGQGNFTTPTGLSIANSYSQTAFSASSVNIVHNWGCYPIVQVVDSTGAVLVPMSIVNNTLNDFTVTFSSAVIGTIIASVGAPQPQTVTIVTGNYSILSTDRIVKCTGVGSTITLPTAVSNTGREYLVNNTTAGNIYLTTTSSQTINNQITQLIPPYSTLDVYSDGTGFWIV